MDLISALKSGKRIRRNNWISWFLLTGDPDKITMNISDILADDWIIESPSVTITLEQLNAAFDKLGDSDTVGYIRECIGKELGLIE